MSIEVTQGGTVVTGESVNVFAALAVKSALGLYIKTKMQVNRAYTPKAMREFVTRLTGKTYKASELQKAHDDLAALLDEIKSRAAPVEA